MPSDDFEIYSSASESDTRRALQHFERVRSFFEQLMRVPARQKAEPVRVILFGSKKEYEEYRPTEFAVAYYAPIAGRDYIVMSSAAAEVFPIAVHEYVHLVAQNAGLKLPPWFNEGLAEVFSTLRPAGDKVVVGEPALGRMYALSREKWVPLSVIVGADHDSPYYNEKNKAGSLYSEGWALVHMLQMSPEYGAQFGRLLEEMEKGTPSRKAIEGVYGKSIETIEKDLQAYLRKSTFLTRMVSVKLQNGEKVAAEPAAMFDVKLALLDLANRPGKEKETRARLAELLREDPKRPEPHVALAYLSWRDQRQDEAMKSFQAAVDLGSRNPQMLWDYGRMAGGSQPAQAARVLSLLIADQPARVDVRLVSGQIQVSQKQAKEAIETLSPIKKVSPEDAPKLFQTMAYANLETRNHAMARTYAQRWIDNTKDTEERDRASRILRYLDDLVNAPARAAVSQPPPAQFARPDSDDRPTLARRGLESPGVPPVPVTPQRPGVSGELVELNCQGPLPVFVIQTGAGRVSLLMDNPKDIFIRGLPDDTIDLQCGPQKAARVRVEYDAPPADQTGILGIARIIYFESQTK